jgi:hypothetical protein
MYPADLAEPTWLLPFLFFFFFFCLFLGSNYLCQRAELQPLPQTFRIPFTPNIICRFLFVTYYYCCCFFVTTTSTATIAAYYYFKKWQQFLLCLFFFFFFTLCFEFGVILELRIGFKFVGKWLLRRVPLRRCRRCPHHVQSRRRSIQIYMGSAVKRPRSRSLKERLVFLR